MKKAIGKETIETICNLVNATSDDVTRWHLNLVGCKDGTLIATDGHIMAWGYRSELDGLTFSIPKDFAKHFKKSSMVQFDSDAMTCTDGSVTLKLEEYSKAFDTVLNHYGRSNYDEVKTCTEGQEFSMVFGFNPWLLERLAKALGATKRHPGIKLVMKDKISPLLVTSSQSDIKGILMPMRV